MKKVFLRRVPISDETVSRGRSLFAAQDVTLTIDDSIHAFYSEPVLVLMSLNDYNELSTHEKDVRRKRKDLKEGTPVIVADDNLVFAFRYYFRDGKVFDDGNKTGDVSSWEHIIPYSMFRADDETALLFTEYDYGSMGNQKRAEETARRKKKRHKHKSGVYFKDGYANNIYDD